MVIDELLLNLKDIYFYTLFTMTIDLKLNTIKPLSLLSLNFITPSKYLRNYGIRFTIFKFINQKYEDEGF